MGNFYGNVTLLGADLESVLAAVAPPAFVAADDVAVVVFAGADDIEPTSGSALSGTLGCRAFTAVVHDDDLLMMQAHDGGTLVFECAVPDPEDVFGPGAEVGMTDPTPPEASAFVAALGQGDEAAVRAVLERDYLFASERHQALVEALGLPTFAVGWGYGYLSEGGDDFDGPELHAVDG